MLVRSSYIHNWGRLDKSNFTVRIWCFGTESSSFVQVNRQHLVHCSYMTLSPHHHFISTKSLVRSLSAIPDKCAIVCWYPRLLGTIPLLLDVVVNAHVCCVLRKISNIMKKIWCFPINFPSCPDKKYRSSVWSWYLICPFCPGNLILSRFAGQPMRNVWRNWLGQCAREDGRWWRLFEGHLTIYLTVEKWKTWWNWDFLGFFLTEVEVLDEVQIQATNIRSITYFAYAATMFRSWSWEVVGCQVSRCEEEQLVHEDSDPRPGWEHFWLWSPPFTKIQKMWPKEVMLQESMIPQIEKK